MAKKKASKRAAPKKAAQARAGFSVDQRIKVACEGHCFNGYLGTVTALRDGGAVVKVKLDVKGVEHEYQPAQLVAV